MVKRLFVVVALSVPASMPSLVEAGTVVLESTVWGYICEVDVTTGIDAPNTSVVSHTDVRDGWSVSAEDKLCYRRSRDPRQCDAGMTDWTCVTQIVSGTETTSIR